MRSACLAITSAGLLLAGPLLGCGPTGRGLADEDVAFKAPAIKHAVAEEQKSAAPELVEALNDDDSATRFFAIEGLRRLTGQTFEYHYYDDLATRQPAVERWQQWLREQKR